MRWRASRPQLKRDPLGSAMVPAHTGLRKRLIVFPLLGAGIGIAFATWALVAGGLALAMRTPIHLPLPLLLAYPVSGLLSGVIVALAFPLVRWLGGALVVGVLAMFPLYFFVSLAIDPLSLIDIEVAGAAAVFVGDRKSTRLNSSHPSISYAVFCLKKKK